MLVKKYQNKAVNIAYSLTYNSANAQDIAQEAFLKIYHKIGAFRQQAKFSSWLYRIVVNTAYDFLRRNKQQNISIDEDPSLQIEDNRKSEDPLAKELVRNTLAKLPFEYRSAIVLKEIEGLSYQEIADCLKISIGTVESRIFRARQMMKEILVKKGVFADEV
jgi:RNA polymerase sigma-70 factor (ECF subfamily)